MSQAAADDGSIPDAAGLLRRIHPNWVVEDKNLNAFRVSSAAFKDPAMSVDVEPILAELGLDWHFSLQAHPEHSLVRLKAATARSVGQAVVHDPRPDNKAHAEVRGKKTPGIANRLLKAAETVFLQSKTSDSL